MSSSSSSSSNLEGQSQSPASSEGSSTSANNRMTASTISHLELPPSSSSSSSSQRSSSSHLAPPPSSSSPTISASGTTTGDDSALDALLLAHDRVSSNDSASHNPLEDDDDHDRHHHNSHSKEDHHHHHHAEGTTASTGAPTTTKHSSSKPDTIPTVSSTGMPRFLPRRTSNSTNSDSTISEAGDPNTNSSSPLAPSGSLLLAAFSSNPLPFTRRASLILAAMAVNLGLPFLNGVMLGFGEIFARAVLAPMFGLAPASINVGAPGSGIGPSPSDVGPRRPVGSGLGIGFDASRIGREKDGSWSRAGTAQLDSTSLGDASRR